MCHLTRNDENLRKVVVNICNPNTFKAEAGTWLLFGIHDNSSKIHIQKLSAPTEKRRLAPDWQELPSQFKELLSSCQDHPETDTQLPPALSSFHWPIPTLRSRLLLTFFHLYCCVSCSVLFWDTKNPGQSPSSKGITSSCPAWET